jgi:hypothetical protein
VFISQSFTFIFSKVREYVFHKKEEFRKRLMPLLLHDIGVFHAMTVSSASSELIEQQDISEVRSLLVLLGDHQLFQGAGARD